MSQPHDKPSVEDILLQLRDRMSRHDEVTRQGTYHRYSNIDLDLDRKISLVLQELNGGR